MNLNSYFDKIICINLNRRNDRWQESFKQFRRIGLTVERYSAIDGNRMNWNHVRNKNKPPGTPDHKFEGVAGCMASHVNIWKMAKANKWKNVLIIEDDCDFINQIQERFNERINQVPSDWDLLYLGGIHETRGGVYIPEKISEHVMKAKRMITTTCYAIKDTCYDLAIDTVLADEPWFHTAVDGYLGAYVQSKCNTYAFNPPLAWQRASFSDIVNDHRDYSDMMKNNNIK
jgi:GR25 family glycosyltransferase involved in LPS biosynthesis|tara:strand:+ start:3570 stop:4259 length:690 start_codon:yes stop_codon:yes gene_type:complete